jgi:peptide/nickel transport system substrate-binding protein
LSEPGSKRRRASLRRRAADRPRSELRHGRRRLASVVGLALLAAGCGSAAGGRAAVVPSSRTFIDLVTQLPADLDESGTPGPATQILQSWSSELVRPSPARPGPDAVLPPADSVVPYLAVSWHAGPHGDYTFQLRRGVRGPTGDPFTAADVSWSIARDLATSPVAPFLFSLANLDTRDPVTILGRYAVRINVTAPSPFLLGVLTWFDEGIFDRNLYLAHATASDPWAERWGSTHSATFGAYYVSDFLASRRLVLLANPYSWVRPYYRKVEIKEMSSGGHRLNALLSGSADHTSALDWTSYTQAVEFASASHVSASILQVGPTIESWLLDVSHGPLASVLVRRALSLALERTDLSGRIWAGHAVPDVLSVPAVYGQPQPAGYGVAEARRLLRAAGYAHGFELHVYVGAELGNGDEAKELALLTTQLAQVGITLDATVVYDDDQLLALAEAHKLVSTIEDIAPPLTGAAFLLISGEDASIDPVSPAAADGYRNRELDALLARIRTTPAGPASQRLAARAEQIVNADVPEVNLFELPVQNVTRSDITGYAAYAEPVTYYENLHPSR